MSKRIWILHSEQHEAGWLDCEASDVRTFLGAHTSLERAQRFATLVAEADRAQTNDELEDGEAEHPPVELNWALAYKDMISRDVVHSDTLELGNGAFHFEITQSLLDPENVV